MPRTEEEIDVIAGVGRRQLQEAVTEGHVMVANVPALARKLRTNYIVPILGLPHPISPVMCTHVFPSKMKEFLSSLVGKDAPSDRCAQCFQTREQIETRAAKARGEEARP